jgi:hypothetical protein
MRIPTHCEIEVAGEIDPEMAGYAHAEPDVLFWNRAGGDVAAVASQLSGHIAESKA